jgi:hypothetical protein
MEMQVREDDSNKLSVKQRRELARQKKKEEAERKRKEREEEKRFLILFVCLACPLNRT